MNLTDKEIVKALECCIIDHLCNNCPLNNRRVDCLKIDQYAIDLINRLQAENERLKNAYKQCAWERDIFQEGMKEEIKKECSYLQLDINTIKIEAYKECIEKVKEELSLLRKECRKVLDNDGVFAIDRARKKVDNLLKEMVGE